MQDSQQRDQLALERTHLANERTLLAYLRSALAFCAAGAAIMHFYPASTTLFSLASGLIIAGAGLGLWGGWRFVRVKKRLGS